MTSEERLRRKNEFDGNLVSGVREFNLGTRRDLHLKRRASRQEQYVNPETGLLRAELARHRVCPVCQADDAVPAFVKEGFRHVSCQRCRMFYVNPVLGDERRHSFYLDEESWTAVLLNETQQALDRKRFEYGLDLIEKHASRRGRLLDVGCGPGLFLQAARERGWSVQGVEFNQWCLEHLGRLEIETIDVPLERAGLEPDSYDCVTLWDVLEHIIDPGAFLGMVRRILGPRGIVLIQVPNIDSLVSRILHERSATFGGDSHVNFFNVSTLTRLLEQAGLWVIEAETLLTELGTVNNHLNYEDPYFGQGPPVLDFLTPEYIHERMLGSRLLMMARADKNQGE